MVVDLHKPIAALAAADAAMLGAAIKDAGLLTEAARRLDTAEGPDALAAALKHNLQVWVAIRAELARHAGMPQMIRQNLMSLADYVIKASLSAESEPLSAHTVRTLVLINLRVSAGLLEGQVRAMIQERARALWHSRGCPDSEDEDIWLEAERELMAPLQA